MRLRLLFLCLLLSIPSLAWATAETLYVRPASACTFSGNGSAYGCAASAGAAGAWKSMTAIVWNVTDETAHAVDPGDTLKVCGSFTTADRKSANYHLYMQAGGSSGKIITITGDCTADGGSSTADFDGGTSTLYGIGTEQYTYLLVNNLVMHDFASRGVHGYLSTSADITIDKFVTYDHLTITNVRGAGKIGIDLRGTHITVTNCTVSNIGDDAIWNAGHHFTASSNTISSYSMDATDGDGIQLGAGAVDGSIFSYNVINHADFDTKYCIVSNGATDGGFIQILYNTCTRGLADTAGAGSRTDGPALYQGNIFIGGSIGVHCNAITGGRCDVIANVFQSTNGDAVRCGTTTACKVYNNTIIGSTIGITFPGNISIAIAKNNIITGTVTGIDKTAGSNPIDQYNDLYSNTTNLKVLGVSAALGTGSITTNPLLISTYLIDAGSPAYRAGTTLTECVDYLGRTCQSPPNIGADQNWSPSPAAPTVFGVNGPLTATSAMLVWNPSAGANVAGYKLYRSTVSGLYVTVLKDMSLVGAEALHSPPTRFIDKVATPVTYYYTVTAYNDSGNEGPRSAEVTVIYTGLDRSVRLQYIFQPVASSTFSRGNANPISEGGVWATDQSGSGSFQVQSGVVLSTDTTADSGARYIGTGFNANQYSRANLTGGGTNSGAGIGLTICASSSARTMYRFTVNHNVTTNAFLYRYVAGVATLVTGGSWLQTFVDGDQFTFANVGETLYVFRGSTLVKTIDDTGGGVVASGRFPGLAHSSTTNVNGTADNWSGGNFRLAY